MTKLKLFPKIFMSTLLLFMCLIAIIHTGIFYLMPRIYSDMKEAESVRRIDDLAARLDGQSKEVMMKIAETYTQKHVVNVMLEMDKEEYYFGNTTVIDIGNSEEVKSDLKIALPQSYQQSEYVISKIRKIKNAMGQSVTLQLMIDVTSIKEARQATIRSLPYTLVFSIICSLIFSYIYNRLTVRPIRKMVAVTDEMTHLNRSERYPVKGQDEFNMLGQHINELYESLLATIDSLAEENEYIIQLEEERITFLRAASHELKTPLTSLRLVIENMVLNVGPYKDRDKYLNESLLEKVFSNLLSNAVHVTPDGGKISLSLIDGRLSVKNQCPPIPPENLRKVFEPLYRLEQSRNSEFGGSGMGLYIVKFFLGKKGYAFDFQPYEEGVDFWIQF
ncbi:HAMP domain-containing sensor histidine kinase [Streptococcus gallinaceus]